MRAWLLGVAAIAVLGANAACAADLEAAKKERDEAVALAAGRPR